MWNAVLVLVVTGFLIISNGVGAQTLERDEVRLLVDAVVCPDLKRAQWFEDRFRRNRESALIRLRMENGRSHRHLELREPKEIDTCTLESLLRVTVLDRTHMRNRYTFIRVAVTRPIYTGALSFRITTRIAHVYAMALDDESPEYGGIAFWTKSP